MKLNRLIVSFLLTCLVLVGCAETTPLDQALNQLSSARGVRIDWSLSYRGRHDVMIFTIDGDKTLVRHGTEKVYMKINPFWRNVDVYRERPSLGWTKSTFSFERMGYDYPSSGMKFNIPRDYVRADSKDEQKFSIASRYFDQYEDFFDIAAIEDSSAPALMSIVFLITEDGNFDQFIVTINTDDGIATLTLEFTQFNETSVELPKLGKD